MIAGRSRVFAVAAVVTAILTSVGCADTSDDVQCDPFPFGTNIVNVVFASIVGKLFPNSCLCAAPCRAENVGDFVYFFYTVSGESHYYRMDKNNTAMNKMMFESYDSVKFLVHGYTDRVQFNKTGWMEPTGLALANSSNAIVVLVDYGNVSSCNYERTVEEIVPSVGIYLSEFIRSYELDPNKIELIGHSLGAHVAGYTGASMNGTIFRITGLDAAGPGFFDKGLNKSCAQFVQVLHTNGGDLGSSKLLGDVDFYANNKSASQPGCPFKQCGHAKAIFYYYASLLPQYEFIGFDCERQHAKQSASFSRFGIFNDGDEGEFCFNTTACFPYMIPLIEATTMSLDSTSAATSTMVRSTQETDPDSASVSEVTDAMTTMPTTVAVAASTTMQPPSEQPSARQTKKRKYHKVQRTKLKRLCARTYDKRCDSDCNDDCFRYDRDLD